MAVVYMNLGSCMDCPLRDSKVIHFDPNGAPKYTWQFTCHVTGADVTDIGERGSPDFPAWCPVLVRPGVIPDDLYEMIDKGDNIETHSGNW